MNIKERYYSSDVLGELFFEHHRITEHEKDYCNNGIGRKINQVQSVTVYFGSFETLQY